VKLAGNEYTMRRLGLSELRDLVKGDHCEGYSCTETLVVGVLKWQRTRERRILWHEAVHIFEDALELDLTEAQVNMLAMLVDMAVQDNEELR